MKRTIPFLLAIALLLTLGACGKEGGGQTTTASTTTPEITQGPAYEYAIRTTLEEEKLFDMGVIQFQFSRPFFEETSPLAATANAVYAQMEAAFREKAQGIIDETIEIQYSPWNYTELSEASYEANGVVSFTTTGDWYMGGVHNSWITGHTFDFDRDRELKLGDVLNGDNAQITEALVSLFFEQTGSEETDDSDVRAQSGPDANFYLAEDGVHVFYMPYVIPATQDGVDILIPWASELVRPLQ